MMLTAALTLAWGCSSDSDDAHGGASFTAAEQPAWTVDWTWHDEAPNWKNPAPTLHESRMYVVLKLDERYGGYSTDADRMAIFLDGECRGMGLRNVTADGSVYFPVIVAGDNEDLERLTEVRYYCASMKQLFVMPGFYGFTPDRTIGTDEDEYVVFGDGSPKYLLNEVNVLLTGNGPSGHRPADIVGAFVGDECRGVGIAGEPMQVWTLHGEEEQVHFRYYSAEKGGIYSFPETFVMDGAFRGDITLAF